MTRPGTTQRRRRPSAAWIAALAVGMGSWLPAQAQQAELRMSRRPHYVGVPVQNDFRFLEEVPSETPASRAMARQLKKAGFRFVGPTTCYAFMQSAGLVNDHLVSCDAHQSCQAVGAETTFVTVENRSGQPAKIALPGAKPQRVAPGEEVQRIELSS